jgi:hypothetical protein
MEVDVAAVPGEVDEPDDDDLDDDLDDDAELDDEDEDDLDDDDAELNSRSAKTNQLWSDAGVDPVEIALPGGVGYTLRAYRSSAEVAQGEISRSEDLDDFDAASAAVARRRRSSDAGDEHDELDDDLADLDEDDLDDEDEIDFNEEDEDEDDEEEDEEEEAEDDDEDAEQEVPVFLGRNGRVYLFHSQEKLVEFVKSSADHDLSQLDAWATLAKKITTEDVEPLDEDTYELDLVVENLRGGPDAWDSALILKAGEIARDLGFALRLDPVIIALSPGSPLDDLDEALRSAEGGGVGSFFAKRKLRKIPAQQSSLAWRTIIGKISAAAEWRD